MYLERAVAALRAHGITIDDESLAHLSPIGWDTHQSDRRLYLAGHKQPPKRCLQASKTLGSLKRVIEIPWRTIFDVWCSDPTYATPRVTAEKFGGSPAPSRGSHRSEPQCSRRAHLLSPGRPSKLVV